MVMTESSELANTIDADAGPAKGSYKLWHEKPVGKFCVGFMVFVAAEVLVGITLHWIFHIV